MTVWPAGRFVPPDFEADPDWYEKTKAMVDGMREELSRPDPLAPPEGYGEPQQELAPCLDRCAGDLAQCKARVEYVITIGCVNEHVGPVGDCEQHARQLTNSLARLVCGRCGAPIQILRCEPEMPPPTGINELVSKIFDGRPE